MEWTIKVIDNRTKLIASQGRDVKALAALNSTASDSVSIRFEGAPALNYDMGGGIDAAIGYIRGVERAATVYAKEMGRKR